MKKVSRHIIQFTAFFIICSVLLNILYLTIITTTDWDFKKRIESLRFKNPDFSLLVFGSSLASYGIDTELLTRGGIKSYNLALVGNSIKTSYVQLSEYLEKYPQRPKCIILAINSYLERFDQEGIHPVVEFTMKGQKIDLKDIPLSKFGWQGTELFKKAFSREYRSRSLSAGQVRGNNVVPDDTKVNAHSLDRSKYESSYWIGKMAELCAKEHVELILVEIPGVNEARNSDDTGPYRIVLKNGYTPILYNLNSMDFCKYIDPKADWIGLSHFNAKGAEKFTSEMIKIITSDSTIQLNYTDPFLLEPDN